LVSIRYSPPEILQFYNFASLAGKRLTTPLLGFLGVLNPLVLWVVIQTPKRHILGCEIAMKFGTGVDVLEVVTWAEFDL